MFDAEKIIAGLGLKSEEEKNRIRRLIEEYESLKFRVRLLEEKKSRLEKRKTDSPTTDAKTYCDNYSLLASIVNCLSRLNNLDLPRLEEELRVYSCEL